MPVLHARSCVLVLECAPRLVSAPADPSLGPCACRPLPHAPLQKMRAHTVRPDGDPDGDRARMRSWRSRAPYFEGAVRSREERIKGRGSCASCAVGRLVLRGPEYSARPRTQRSGLARASWSTSNSRCAPASLLTSQDVLRRLSYLPITYRRLLFPSQACPPQAASPMW